MIKASYLYYSGIKKTLFVSIINKRGSAVQKTLVMFFGEIGEKLKKILRMPLSNPFLRIRSKMAL